MTSDRSSSSKSPFSVGHLSYRHLEITKFSEYLVTSELRTVTVAILSASQLLSILGIRNRIREPTYFGRWSANERHRTVI